MKKYRDAFDSDAHQPLVSVIVNCFNGAKYVDEAIESVLSQTYQNWELIFWDNQSTDNSATIFEKYKDARLQYFLSDRHTRLYQARRMAVDNCSGDFLAFHDVDDYWVPEKLELQVSAAVLSQAAIVYSDYFFENKKNETMRLIKSNRLANGNAFQNLSKKNSIALSTLMVRSDVYHKEGGFDSRFNIIGDYDLVLRVSAKHPLHCLQRPLAFYRWHGENLSIEQSGAEIEEIKIWLTQYSNEEWATPSGIKNLHDQVNYGLVKQRCQNKQRCSAVNLIWKIRDVRFFLRAICWLIIPYPLAIKLQT